jgi:hypothetical protein
MFQKEAPIFEKRSVDQRSGARSLHYLIVGNPALGGPADLPCRVHWRVSDFSMLSGLDTASGARGHESDVSH